MEIQVVLININFCISFSIFVCLLIAKCLLYSRKYTWTQLPSVSIDIFYNKNIFLLCPLHGQVDFHWKWFQAGSNIYSLMQVRSSAWRLYPVSHTQWKVPRVLIQRCWQPPFTTAHSSMSRGARQMVRITMSFQC